MSIFAVCSPNILFFLGLFVLLSASRLLHSGVLWEPEYLPLAAALQMKRGLVLYRDIWFDKPPLVAAIYLLIGAKTGITLRIFDAVYAFLACFLAFRITGKILAAALLGFFLIFDTQSAVIPMGADLLLLIPHLAAIGFVLEKRPFLAGIAAGVGFLFNAKAFFVLAACCVFAWPEVLPLLGGFAIPSLVALPFLDWAPYFDQVWRWPAEYAGSPVVSDPVWNGLVRTVNWGGFHAALVIGSVLYFRNWRYWSWAALSYAGVVLGWRFFPRYFFLLLPCLVIMTSCARRKWVLLLLVVPLLRFGRPYFSVSNSPDLALDRDSRESAKIALSIAPPNASLYVWGYRPEIFIYSNLSPATRYLDSQAMTGVPADRHLTQSTVVSTKRTHEARVELANSKPDVLIDGLSMFNPALAMDKYDDLRPWFAQYHEAARTKETVIYLRNR